MTTREAEIRLQRARMLESAQALSRVVSLRSDIAEARKRLRGIESQLAERPGNPTAVEASDWLHDHIQTLTAILTEAEAHCRDINPEGLATHEAEVAATVKSAREAREAEQAAAEAARLEKAEADGAARLEKIRIRTLEALER